MKTDSSHVNDLTRLLDEAGIDCRVGSDAPVVDISSIETGNEAQAIVSVREEDFEAARAVMEHDSLQVELLSNHYLLTFSDDHLGTNVRLDIRTPVRGAGNVCGGKQTVSRSGSLVDRAFPRSLPGSDRMVRLSRGGRSA